MDSRGMAQQLHVRLHQRDVASSIPVGGVRFCFFLLPRLLLLQLMMLLLLWLLLLLLLLLWLLLWLLLLLLLLLLLSLACYFCMAGWSFLQSRCRVAFLLGVASHAQHYSDEKG